MLRHEMLIFKLQEVVLTHDSLGVAIETYRTVAEIEVCINRSHKSTITETGLNVDVITQTGLTYYQDFEDNKVYRLDGVCNYKVKSVIRGRITQLLLEGVTHE